MKRYAGIFCLFLISTFLCRIGMYAQENKALDAYEKSKGYYEKTRDVLLDSVEKCDTALQYLEQSRIALEDSLQYSDYALTVQQREGRIRLKQDITMYRDYITTLRSGYQSQQDAEENYEARYYREAMSFYEEAIANFSNALDSEWLKSAGQQVKDKEGDRISALIHEIERRRSLAERMIWYKGRGATRYEEGK